MNLQRFIIQTGIGIDQHGQDMTKAAQRAVEDAIRRNCLCGLKEIFSVSSMDDIMVEVTIAAPYPDKVNQAAVLEVLPFGRRTCKVVQGGMVVVGQKDPKYGDKTDEYLIANACVTVKLDLDNVKIPR
ncbi:MAG: Lin0512 family protein [Candidatus Tectomicrobia bacterium]|uniref:Lin0512 family protein n=1 Tax=Tectimicrobiota bacterium TaxID=2528274 RepID=A0A933GMN3_UNCTE|nr:Lin0512 family protein [Candidatus Tectomicrobia bacterium]